MSDLKTWVPLSDLNWPCSVSHKTQEALKFMPCFRFGLKSAPGTYMWPSENAQKQSSSIAWMPDIHPCRYDPDWGWQIVWVPEEWLCSLQVKAVPWAWGDPISRCCFQGYFCFITNDYLMQLQNPGLPHSHQGAITTRVRTKACSPSGSCLVWYSMAQLQQEEWRVLRSHHCFYMAPRHPTLVNLDDPPVTGNLRCRHSSA